MAKHRLVTIGDSITQGVRSGAAVDGTQAWPAFLSEAMGIGDSFRSPVIATRDRGLPINLEHVFDGVLARYGSTLRWYQVPVAALRVRSWMDDVEDYWESGPGSAAPVADPAQGPYHNLGIMGLDLRDALSLTAAECDRRIAAAGADDALVRQIPEAAGYRVARRVLSAAGPDRTVFDAARALAADGGVEVLVVMLGANNALRVASELELRWSGPGFDDLDAKGAYTLWQPAHFATEYAAVVDEAASVGAEHTVLVTVPKVTIIPLARGVGDKVEPGSCYYEHYTRIWVDDDSFQPGHDRHITHREARTADEAIDAYNETIRAAADARGPSWHVFELDRLLDSMATRRYIEDPAARPPDFVPYQWPPPLDDLDPVLGTRYFRSDNGRRTDGGIFSLDGIHPTVVASAIVARELAVLLRGAGVDVDDVDLGAALAADRLNSEPPDIVDSVLRILGRLDQLADVFTAIARHGR